MIFLISLLFAFQARADVLLDCNGDLPFRIREPGRSPAAQTTGGRLSLRNPAAAARIEIGPSGAVMAEVTALDLHVVKQNPGASSVKIRWSHFSDGFSAEIASVNSRAKWSLICAKKNTGYTLVPEPRSEKPLAQPFLFKPKK
jgi:hypothetical protein